MKLVKNSVIAFFFIFFIFSFVSAYQPHQQNQNYSYSDTIANADQCNLTSITYPNGSSNDLNIEMTKEGFKFSTLIDGSNFSNLGDTCWGIICYDSDATPEYASGSKCLTITSSGKQPSISTGIANILLISFFIFLIIFVHYIYSKTNFEKWHNSIINKYENKNYVKLVLSSIFYNILKNSFIIYYLIGFPLLLILTDIAYSFEVTSMIQILSVILSIYTIGSIIVAIYLFSHVQEWIIDLLEQIKNMDWGVQ